MCKPEKSIQEINRAVEDVNRPMRWQEAEDLAQRYLRSVLDTWHRFERELFDLIKNEISSDSLTYDSLLRAERRDTKILTQKRDTTTQELSQILSRLREFLPQDQIRQIEALFDRYVEIYFPGGGAITLNDGIFNIHIPEAFEQGYEKAYDEMEKAARQQGALRRFRDAGVTRAFVFDPDSPIVRNYWGQAYRLVTSKITIAAKGEVLGAMVEGFAEGLDWQQISRNIHKRVGISYRYHWTRLVRTELTKTYYESFHERYAQVEEIEYIKHSISIGACPICVALEGYYTKGFQPRLPADTHPNCRCLHLPVFRLPSGVDLKR